MPLMRNVSFSAAPLKIKDSDGAFARAFAVIFKQTIQKQRSSLTFASIFYLN